MARQEFLSGGYRGKLGQTVGMRYRDRYTVREYVIPRDPQAPAQMAHRALFATAARLSKESRQINGNNGEWDTSQMSEYAARLKQAYAHLAAGETAAQAFPLHPDGWTPPFEIKLASAAVDAMEQTATANFTQLDGFAGHWLELGFTARNDAGETTAAKTYPRPLITATPPLSYSLTFDFIDFADTITVDFGARVYATETGTDDLIDLDGIFATYTPIPQPVMVLQSASADANTAFFSISFSQLDIDPSFWLELSFNGLNGGGGVAVSKTFPRELRGSSTALSFSKAIGTIDWNGTASLEVYAKVWRTETGTADLIASIQGPGTFVPLAVPVFTMLSGIVHAYTCSLFVLPRKAENCTGKYLEFSFIAKNAEGVQMVAKTLPRTLISAPLPLDYSQNFDWVDFGASTNATITAKVWETATGGTSPLCTDTVNAVYDAVPAPVITFSQGSVNSATLVFTAQLSALQYCRNKFLEFGWQVKNSGGTVIKSGTFPRTLIDYGPPGLFTGTIPAPLGGLGTSCVILAKVWDTQTGGSTPYATQTFAGTYRPLYESDFSFSTVKTNTSSTGVYLIRNFPVGATGLFAYVMGDVEDAAHNFLGQTYDSGHDFITSGGAYFVPFEDSYPSWRYLAGEVSIYTDDSGDVLLFEVAYSDSRY